MKEKIVGLISTISNKIVSGLEDEGGLGHYHHPSLAETVEQAKQEWINAKRYFESVSDPELVDYSIYVLEAAERKYMYLLKKAREEGIRADLTLS
ncbi:MAG TPA: YaaL family protein [Clostridia bacterium]|jgi:hypothetical protein|nr:YaaL family protein [Clostridia bacterium]